MKKSDNKENKKKKIVNKHLCQKCFDEKEKINGSLSSKFSRSNKDEILGNSTIGRSNAAVAISRQCTALQCNALSDRRNNASIG